MTITMPDVADTRAAMLRAYRDALHEVLAESTYTVGELRNAADDAGVLAVAATGDLATAAAVDDGISGLRVVLRKDVDEALNAIFGQPVPMTSDTTAEVHTPATIICSTICPKCGLAQPISVSLKPELLVSDDGSEIRLKAKAKGRTHICGQLPLPDTTDQVDGQQELPLGDEDDELFDPEPVATCRVCGCTEDAACEGGCSWVEDPDGGDLCSACLPQLEAGAVITAEVDDCPFPGCSLRIDHEGEHADAVKAAGPTCDVAFGPDRVCVRAMGHDGDHDDLDDLPF